MLSLEVEWLGVTVVVVIRVNGILVFVAFELHDVAMLKEGDGLSAATAGEGTVSDVTGTVEPLGDER